MTIEIPINSYQQVLGTLRLTLVIHSVSPAKSVLGQEKIEFSTGTLTKGTIKAKNTGVNNTVNSDNEWGFPLHMIDLSPNMGLIMDLAA